MSVALKKTRVDVTLLTVTDARRRAVFLSTFVPFFVGRSAGRTASWSVWNRRTGLDCFCAKGATFPDVLRTCVQTPWHVVLMAVQFFFVPGVHHSRTDRGPH